MLTMTRHGDTTMPVTVHSETDIDAAISAIPVGLEWQKSALCAQTDIDLFFPEEGGSVRLAKQICRACSVRAECLDYALEHAGEFGVWGGMTVQERAWIRKKVAA